jgi:hypothetical protein
VAGYFVVAIARLGMDIEKKNDIIGAMEKHNGENLALPSVYLGV